MSDLLACITDILGGVINDLLTTDTLGELITVGSADLSYHGYLGGVYLVGPVDLYHGYLE